MITIILIVRVSFSKEALRIDYINNNNESYARELQRQLNDGW